MSEYEIWHNPRCSKSRQTLERLGDAGIDAHIVEYLKSPPTRERLAEVVALLGFDHPRSMMRTKEAAYGELGLAEVESSSALLDAMVEHPELIERPVVIRDNARAVLGRPPDNVDALL